MTAISALKCQYLRLWRSADEIIDQQYALNFNRLWKLQSVNSHRADPVTNKSRLSHRVKVGAGRLELAGRSGSTKVHHRHKVLGFVNKGFGQPIAFEGSQRLGECLPLPALWVECPTLFPGASQWLLANSTPWSLRSSRNQRHQRHQQHQPQQQHGSSSSPPPDLGNRHRFAPRPCP